MGLTEWFLVVVVVVVLIYDAAALMLWGVESTVSRVVTRWSKQFPIIPFLVGVVAGHWFWR